MAGCQIFVKSPGISGSGFCVCYFCFSGGCLQAFEIDVAESLQDALWREAALLPLEAIKLGMKCGQNGIDGVGNIEWCQFSAFYCFSK